MKRLLEGAWAFLSFGFCWVRTQDSSPEERHSRYHLESQEQPSLDTKSAEALDFRGFRTVRNQFVLLTSRSLWCFARAARNRLRHSPKHLCHRSGAGTWPYTLGLAQLGGCVEPEPHWGHHDAETVQPLVFRRALLPAEFRVGRCCLKGEEVKEKNTRKEAAACPGGLSNWGQWSMNVVLQTHVWQCSHILKMNSHSTHPLLSLEISPPRYNDSDRLQRNTAFREKVSVNTLLEIFILNISVAFQFIIVLLVSLHKSAMHLY